MSVEKPNLVRVLSDSWCIISSNPLHFFTLSSLFIFPISLFSIILTLTWPHPSTSAHPFSHYRRLFFMQTSEAPSTDTSQTISYLLYSIPILLLLFCFVLSITTTIFHGFHNKPLKLSSSLKSIISSFFPLLATKIAYAVIMLAILAALVFLMVLCFLGLMFLGFAVDPDSTSFKVVTIVQRAAYVAVCVYLDVEWILTDASVVVDSKWGFAAFGRSWRLVKGARGVAFSINVLIWVLQMMAGVLFYSLISRSSGGGCVAAVGMGVKAAVYAFLSGFGWAANTVLFVYCKAFHGEMELPATEKVGHVYIQLPDDDVIVDDATY